MARSDIYLGLVGERYGAMLASGRSPTHEEYREARRRGLRVAVWVAANGDARQGDARDFVAEVQTFHTTGSWDSPDALVASVQARIRELAAEDESPWVKLGEVVFRAASIADDGQRLTIEMRSRDPEVLAALESLRPDGWGRTPELTVTTADRSGVARVTEVTSRTSSANSRALTLAADVRWADGQRSSLASGINGVTVEEQVEIGLRAGLFGEPLPDQLGLLASMVDTDDPLAMLDGIALAHDTYRGVARLLVVERLFGMQAASRVSQFDVGPAHGGRRRVELEWHDARYATNIAPQRREIAGWRTASR